MLIFNILKVRFCEMFCVDHIDQTEEGYKMQEYFT